MSPVPKIERPIERLAFDQQEAAAALGVSINHFERHIKPYLPVVMCGAKKLYTRRGIEAWLLGEEIVAGRRRR